MNIYVNAHGMVYVGPAAPPLLSSCCGLTCTALNIVSHFIRCPVTVLVVIHWLYVDWSSCWVQHPCVGGDVVLEEGEVAPCMYLCVWVWRLFCVLTRTPFACSLKGGPRAPLLNGLRNLKKRRSLIAVLPLLPSAPGTED